MGYIAGPRALLYPNGPREALPNCNLPIDRPTSVRSPDTRGCRQLATVGQTERLETVELQRVAAVTRHPLRSIRFGCPRDHRRRLADGRPVAHQAASLLCSSPTRPPSCLTETGRSLRRSSLRVAPFVWPRECPQSAVPGDFPAVLGWVLLAPPPRQTGVQVSQLPKKSLKISRPEDS